MLLHTEDEPGGPKHTGPVHTMHTSTGHQRGQPSLDSSGTASTAGASSRARHMTTSHSPSSASSASFVPHPPRGPRAELTPSPILVYGRQHRGAGGASSASGVPGQGHMRRESSGSNSNPSRPQWGRMNSHGSAAALLLDQLDGVPSDALAVRLSPHQSPGTSSSSRRGFFRSNSGHSFEDSLSAVMPSHGPRKRHVNSPLVRGRSHVNSPLAPRGERRSSSHGSSGDGRDSSRDAGSDGGVTDQLTELTLRRAELWLGGDRRGSSKGGPDGATHGSPRYMPAASAMRARHGAGPSPGNDGGTHLARPHRGIAFGPRATSTREGSGSGGAGGGSLRSSSLAAAATSVVSPRAPETGAKGTTQSGSGRDGGGTWFGSDNLSFKSRGSGNIVTGGSNHDILASMTPIHANTHHEGLVPRPPAEPASATSGSPRAARSQRVMNGMTMMKSTGSYLGASANAGDGGPANSRRPLGASDDATPTADGAGSERPHYGRRAGAGATHGHEMASQRASRANPDSDLDALLAETGCDLLPSVAEVTPHRRQSSHNQDRRGRMNRGEFLPVGGAQPPATATSVASAGSNVSGRRSARFNPRTGVNGSTPGSQPGGPHGGWSGDRWSKGGAAHSGYSGGSGPDTSSSQASGGRYGTASNRLRSVARRLMGN